MVGEMPDPPACRATNPDRGLCRGNERLSEVLSVSVIERCRSAHTSLTSVGRLLASCEKRERVHRVEMTIV